MKKSVAMCTYNGEKYIYEQLESIINQTETIDEIIICDDGSRDRTISIIKCIAKKSPVPIIIIQNPINLGYVRNFERAISLCSGDVIFLSDQDDIWNRQKVKVICDFFNNHPDKSFVFTNSTLINKSGVPTYPMTLFDVVGMNKSTKKLFDTGQEDQILSTSGRVTGATTALRASFVPYCLPFPNLEQLHDEMIAVTATIWKKIAYIDECLMKYRIHDKQSVGLGALFIYPPQKWEIATNLLMWHRQLVESWNIDQASRIEFLHKRFWAIRASFLSPLLIIGFYFSHRYQKYNTNSSKIFRQDLISIFSRWMIHLTRIGKLKISFNDLLGLR